MSLFLIKICHQDGNEEGHRFDEYRFNPTEKTITIYRDDIDPYVLDLSHGAHAYAQAGRETFSVFNKPRSNNNFFLGGSQ